VKKYLILGLVFTFILSMNISLAVENISSCGAVLNTSGETYYLNQSLTIWKDLTCVNITANNVTLDCRGNTINANPITNLIFISRDSAQNTNITIKNCILINGTMHNIYFKNSNNNTIQNITSSLSPDGIYFEYSNNNTILNSIANDNSYGFYLYSSNYNTILNSTANDNSYGFFLYSSKNNTILNSIANSNSNGFSLYSSNYNTIQIGRAHV